MDSFHAIVQRIVDLEDLVQSAPERLKGTTQIEDRVKELRVRYVELREFWPIVEGNGTMRWTYPIDESKE